MGDHAPPPRHEEQSHGSSGVNPTDLIYVAIVVLTVVLRMCVSGSSSSYTPYEPYRPPIYEPDLRFDPLDIPTFEPIVIPDYEPIDVDRLLQIPVDIGLPVLTLCLDGFGHPREACEHGPELRQALAHSRAVVALERLL